MGIHVGPVRGPRRFRIPGRAVLDNITARLVAVVALGLGTILVARVGGAEDVGLLALLRVVPGLVGVLAACGLPGAMGYFLAGPHSTEARLWPTILAVLTAGVGLGMAAWFLLMPAIHALLFPTTSTLVMVLAGVSVGTQLPLAVAKSSLQGLDDRRGSNVVTGAEEAAFIPAFARRLPARASRAPAAGGRAHRRGRRRRRRRLGPTGATGAPPGDADDRAPGPRRSPAASCRSASSVRSVAWSTCSTCASTSSSWDTWPARYLSASTPWRRSSRSCVKLPALAVTWVSYPQMARLGPDGSAKLVRRQLPWLIGLGIAGAVVLALAAGPLLPALYGQEFVESVVPAAIIAVGLVASPAGGLASGYLLGTRRPGTNSVLQAVGLLATLGLDVLLIPHFGVIGAAVASAIAYLVTDLSTLLVVRHLTARVP